MKPRTEQNYANTREFKSNQHYLIATTYILIIINSYKTIVKDSASKSLYYIHLLWEEFRETTLVCWGLITLSNHPKKIAITNQTYLITL